MKVSLLVADLNEVTRTSLGDDPLNNRAKNGIKRFCNFILPVNVGNIIRARS